LPGFRENLIPIRQYDRDVPLAVLHTSIEQGDVQLRVWRRAEDGWLVISGEIDSWSVEAVREALSEALREGGDVHLDVSRLLFCDVTGIRVIVTAAANLEPGRRLLLHGLDPHLHKVFKVVGWAGIPSLSLDGPEVYAT
jgi:anti-anti-sigma factor